MKNPFRQSARAQTSAPVGTGSSEAIQTRISQLHALGHRPWWVLAGFTLISILAIPGLLLPPLTPELRQLLGPPPPLVLINLALVVYTFSALVLSLARMINGADAGRCWVPLLYITPFYLFYYFAEALRDNYWAIFAAGLTVTGMECYRCWTWARESLVEEEKALARLQRMAKFSEAVAAEVGGDASKERAEL
jgi:O-antigen/teichoic acid export membrane protein